MKRQSTNRGRTRSAGRTVTKGVVVVALTLGLSFAACAGTNQGERSMPTAEKNQPFPVYEAFLESLDDLVAMPAGPERDASIDAFWGRLAEAGRIPFIVGERVAFLYRGEAREVVWYGDWNNWGRDGVTGSLPCQGVRLGDTDLWMLEASFPADARLDYKIVRNGGDWLLDPANPKTQKGGYGPNSLLAMPDWVPPAEAMRREGVARGTLEPKRTIASGELGYDVNYRVYVPAGIDPAVREGAKGIPSIYVTDGHEYAADDMGSLVIVLDNLIADGRIEPILAVFVDPREVGNPGNNRRGAEYVGNEAFIRFVCDELVPQIDDAYPTDTAPDRRAILGTSLGGLNAATFGVLRSDVFGNLAIQSPAFYHWPEIYDLYREKPRLPLRIFMNNGRFGDSLGALGMIPIFEDKGYPFRFIEVNDGHSWGHWRALVDDALEFLFPAR